MVEAIFQILSAGLSIWDHKERSKYVDRLMGLKRDYYAETNKPAAERSDAVLDHLEHELRLLGLAFAAGVGQSNAANKPGSTGA